MDFSVTDEQQAAVSLLDQILADRCTLERLKTVAVGAEPFDRGLWAELAKADLVGLSLPEALGGGGFGFIEACLLMEQQGRHVAPVPFLANVVGGAMPIVEFGTDAQRHAYVPGVCAGTTLLTAALEEPNASARAPYTSARTTEGGFLLHGAKILVPVAPHVAVMVVSARLDDGRVGLFLVDPSSEGVTCVAEDTMGQWPLYRVGFDGVAVDAASVLGSLDAGQAQLDWLVDRVTAAFCAMSAGVCERALRLTADYATERRQFDRPIGSFQAVGARLADAYIDVEAVRLTMLSAVSLLDAGASADKEVATAKFWACDGASRVAHAALHVHGGISIDVDFPIHRYFLWAKQIESMLGSATQQLVRLGDLIAAEPV